MHSLLDPVENKLFIYFIYLFDPFGWKGVALD